MGNSQSIVQTFLIALGLSFMLTPLVRRLSLAAGWLNKPSPRKVNSKPIPLAGGLAIYCGFVIAVLILFIFKKPFAHDSYKIFGLLVSSFVILLVGIADDIEGLIPRRKLFYQIVAAEIAYLSGFSIIKVGTPIGGAFNVPFLISMGLTVFWIVGFTNAINLLDGLDGLATGVVAIISASLFFSGIKENMPLVDILSVALAGSALGFLPYNFYPAKIFLGDTGSMFLGFVISLISIQGAYKGAAFLSFFVPVIAMGVPAIDTGLAILRRLIKGKGVFKPDKEHIHHKILSQEGSQRNAVLKLYFLTICFGMIAVGLSGMKGAWAFFGIVLIVIATLRWIFNFGLADFVRKKELT